MTGCKSGVDLGKEKMFKRIWKHYENNCHAFRETYKHELQAGMGNASRPGSHLIYTKSLSILVQIRHVLFEAKNYKIGGKP